MNVIASNHGRAEKDIEIMRNSMFLLVALGGLTIFALPAAAESNEGSCGAPAAAAPAGPIDLEAIPMKDATGPKAVKGVGDDECDDRSAGGIAGENEASDDD